MHLKRLLFNLVDNAIKYTPSKGAVRITIARSDRFAVVGVEDTGIGIPEEEKERVFKRFYRSADARSQAQGGAGLGLSIAESIAAAHGGRIEIESKPGSGSVFKVWLPLLQHAEETAQP
jgi:signal transduction histidine kinase